MQFANSAGNVIVKVPAGLIQTYNGTFIANHVINDDVAIVNASATIDLSGWSDGVCNPCNFLSSSPVVYENIRCGE